nr:S26 family signal peptidase [Lentzea flava]
MHHRHGGRLPAQQGLQPRHFGSTSDERSAGRGKLSRRGCGRSAHRVPVDSLLVLGDNLARSNDSRRLGYLPADALIGVVLRPLGQR